MLNYDVHLLKTFQWLSTGLNRSGSPTWGPCPRLAPPPLLPLPSTHCASATLASLLFPEQVGPSDAWDFAPAVTSASSTPLSEIHMPPPPLTALWTLSKTATPSSLHPLTRLNFLHRTDDSLIYTFIYLFVFVCLSPAPESKIHTSVNLVYFVPTGSGKESGT